MKICNKNGTKVTLNLLSNLIESSNDETNFPYILLLIYPQVWKIRRAFSNVSSANIKIFKNSVV